MLASARRSAAAGNHIGGSSGTPTPTDNPYGGCWRWVCGRDESLPYGVKMKGMQWNACGPGMPGPYRAVEGEVGGMGEVRGRHVCRPYRAKD